MNLNEVWPRLMIKELIQQGVRTFCIAPGSRSTPLTIAAAQHPLAETHVHYDERGLGYFALGIAKGKGKPTCLIVTSGTAVGNLLPAVMEASHDHIPLIILSGDRPPELHDCGANQTTHQRGIFSSFVRWERALPCPDPKIPRRFVGRVIAQGIEKALSHPKGPIHLNCQFRKPLHEQKKQEEPAHLPCTETTLHQGDLILEDRHIKEIADELREYRRGIILMNGCGSPLDMEKVYSLSRTLQWPIFPDILSPARWEGSGYGVVPYYDLILKSIGANEDFAPEAILQIGDRFVSKRLMDYIESKRPKVHVHLTPHPEKHDPSHTITHRVVSKVDDVLERLPSFISSRPPSEWQTLWLELNQLTKQGIDSFFQNQENLTEPLLFHSLKDSLSSETSLFIANSSPIRTADAFLSPESPISPIFGNRGLSGIDGNIATIAGIARGKGKPMIGIIGDQTFLHDLNSLPLLKGLPVKLIVINNNGGDIFSFLPIYERKEVFTPYFQAPHGYALHSFAPPFGLNQESPKTFSALQEALASPDPMLIEIKTRAGENLSIQNSLLSTLKDIQCAAII